MTTGRINQVTPCGPFGRGRPEPVPSGLAVPCGAGGVFLLLHHRALEARGDRHQAPGRHPCGGRHLGARDTQGQPTLGSPATAGRAPMV